MSEKDTPLRDETIKRLNHRGVELSDIANLVYLLQEPYIQNLTIDECLKSVNVVMRKREVQNAFLTGIELDELAEKNQLSNPLQSIIERDEGLYGVDETLALSVVNLYGSIGFTNYGYIDKTKPGILAKLNAHEKGHIHTFLDDLVGAVAAAAASRLAHQDIATLEDLDK